MSKRFRRFDPSHFFGSNGLAPREANHYDVTIWRRREQGILASFIAYSLSDAFKIIRALRARYPSRMVGISRHQYGAKWVRPDYRLPATVPDYRAFCHLSAYERIGRRRPGIWRKRAETPNLLASLTKTYDL